MSTRCQIEVISGGKHVMLYHHCDGYPEGVGYCLLKLMEEYKNSKYKDEDGIVRRMIRNGMFEVTFWNHSDIEYFYQMDFDKEQVNCMMVNNWGDEMVIEERIQLVYDKEKDVMVDEDIFKEIK